MEGLIGWMSLVGCVCFVRANNLPSDAMDASLLASQSGFPHAPAKCDFGPSANTALNACLGVGHESFLRNYLRILRRTDQAEVHNRCGEYERFKACMDNLFAGCKQELRHRLRHNWLPVIDHFECACSPDQGQEKEKCASELHCMEVQLSGVMADVCDELYRFNTEQQTRPKCHFLHENIHCKEALVTSACGQKAGDLAFHVNKLFWEHKKKSCSIHRRSSTYKGFRYSRTGCPADFITTMDMCSITQLPDNKVLEFSPDNDMIPEQNRQRVGIACKAFRNYTDCMSGVESACPTGTARVLDYSTKLRVYRLKMEHICDKHVQDIFTDNLACYQDVQGDKALKRCNEEHFRKLGQMRKKITPFQFFCEADGAVTQDMITEINNYIECSASHFERQCGEPARNAMEALLRKAFKDPRFLKMEYIPDCVLHDPSATPSPHSKTSDVVSDSAYVNIDTGDDVMEGDSSVHKSRKGTRDAEDSRQVSRSAASPASLKSVPTSNSVGLFAHTFLTICVVMTSPVFFTS